jgi:hypothetical protein
LGQALADLAQAKAQGVELGGKRLEAGELLVGVALAGDQLAADLGGGQAAIQAGGPESRVGLDVVLDEVRDVVEEAGEVALDGFASATGSGVLAGDAGAAFVEGLAEGLACPAEEELGLALPQAEGSDGVGQVAAAGRTPREGRGGTPNQVNDFGSKIHGRASCQWAAGIVQKGLEEAIP